MTMKDGCVYSFEIDELSERNIGESLFTVTKI